MRATDRFVELMELAENDIPLAAACLLIAAHAHPDDAVDRVLAHGLATLDSLAAGCGGGTLDHLRSHLFAGLGFGGNQRRYDDPRNSYLDAVLDRRVGIPITLAVVTIETGNRIGLTLEPVGMPGHFLVGVGDGQYLDAFDSGRLLDEASCRRRLAELGDVEWSAALLDPVGTHAVLARVLANLKRVFTDSQDLVALDWVLELRAAVPGVPHRERAERASVLAALGRYDKAAGQLEQLARIEEVNAMSHPSQGGGETADALRHQAARMRASLN